MQAVDPTAAETALWLYALVLVGWLASASACSFVRLYTYLDTPQPETRGIPP